MNAPLTGRSPANRDKTSCRQVASEAGPPGRRCGGVYQRLIDLPTHGGIEEPIHADRANHLSNATPQEVSQPHQGSAPLIRGVDLLRSKYGRQSKCGPALACHAGPPPARRIQNHPSERRSTKPAPARHTSGPKKLPWGNFSSRPADPPKPSHTPGSPPQPADPGPGQARWKARIRTASRSAAKAGQAQPGRVDRERGSRALFAQRVQARRPRGSTCTYQGPRERLVPVKRAPSREGGRSSSMEVLTRDRRLARRVVHQHQQGIFSGGLSRQLKVSTR